MMELFLCVPSVRAESLFDSPPEVDVTLHSAEFLGPLQYRTWRKMSSIFKPGNIEMSPDHSMNDISFFLNSAKMLIWSS